MIGLFMLCINPFVGLINLGLTNGLTSLGTTSRLLLSVVLASDDVHRHGRPLQQGGVCIRNCPCSCRRKYLDHWRAVMIGGMVPPIAIALSTTFHKKKWTAGELKSGPVNYVMGLCFITEGAIPYASSRSAESHSQLYGRIGGWQVP